MAVKRRVRSPVAALPRRSCSANTWLSDTVSWQIHAEQAAHRVRVIRSVLGAASINGADGSDETSIYPISLDGSPTRFPHPISRVSPGPSRSFASANSPPSAITKRVM